MDILILIVILLSVAVGKAILDRARRREVREDVEFVVTTRLTKYATAHVRK
jgi:hypothetical protein